MNACPKVGVNSCIDGLISHVIYIYIYANRVMIVPYPSELLPMTSSHVRLGEQELFFFQWIGKKEIGSVDYVEY
jgi:hypothetical protein